MTLIRTIGLWWNLANIQYYMYIYTLPWATKTLRLDIGYFNKVSLRKCSYNLHARMHWRTYTYLWKLHSTNHNKIVFTRCAYVHIRRTSATYTPKQPTTRDHWIRKIQNEVQKGDDYKHIHMHKHTHT